MDSPDDMVLCFGSIECLHELLQLPVDSIRKDPSFGDVFARLREFLDFVRSLIIEDSTDDKLRTECTRVILFLLRSIPELFDGPDVVRGVLETIGHAIHTSVEQLFDACHQVLFELVWQLYDNIGEFFGGIAALVLEQIAEKTTINFHIISLRFWYDLAAFEVTKATPEFEPRFCFDTPGLPEVLCESLAELDEADTDIESDYQNQTQIHMVAYDTLKMLYRIRPDPIRDELAAFARAKLDAGSWTDVHAAVLAIVALCDEPRSQLTGDVISDFLPLLVDLVPQSPVPRLVETALWAIGCCIRSYPSLLTSTSVPALMDLAEGVANAEQAPPAIRKRGCNIIAFMADGIEETILDGLFGRLFDIINLYRERMREGFAIHPFLALNALFQNTTEETNEAAFVILPQLLTALASDIPFDIKTGACLSLKAIGCKLGPALPDPDVILDALLRMVEIKGLEVPDDEALMAISTVLICGAAKCRGFGARIYHILMQQLESGNRTFIQVACCTLGDLFVLLSDEVMHLAITTIQTLFEGFTTAGTADQDEILPSIVKCLLMILDTGAAHFVAQSQETCTAIIEFLASLTERQYKNAPQPYLVTLITTILRCYSNIFVRFDSKQFLSAVATIAFPFIEKIHHNNTSDALILHELYSLVHKMGEALKQRINAQLNNRCIRHLVKWGKSSDNQAIRQEAQWIEGYLHDL
jgi:hypothetical protein